MARLLARFLALPPSDQLRTLLLACASLACRLALAVHSLPVVSAALGPLRRLGGAGRRPPGRLWEMADLASVAAFGRRRCLGRSLLLLGLLPAGAVLKVGVRRVGGALDGHAWIEVDNRVLRETPPGHGGFDEILSVAAR